MLSLNLIFVLLFFFSTPLFYSIFGLCLVWGNLKDNTRKRNLRGKVEWNKIKNIFRLYLLFSSWKIWWRENVREIKYKR